MNEKFSWKSGRELPPIFPHSDRKLQVIERYLDVYFDTVAPQPVIDDLNITIVDAFCGGGLYRSGNETRPGSPLAILGCVEAARIRLNLQRVKPLRINATYHFSDANPDHVGHLREVLTSSAFHEALDRTIHLKVGKFEDLLPSIIADIRKRQRKGRSIFVLDQFGYKDVPMSTIQDIFRHLPSAEVILTFSIDALLNYLPKEDDAPTLVHQFGVDQKFLGMWRSLEDEASRRMVGQRNLMQYIHRFSGAAFFTPFMLYSQPESRWIMIAHLSQNQAARDKMLGVHWEQQNSFRHYGPGSWFELGFDARLLESETSLFSFADHDRDKLQRELENEMPRRLFELMRAGGMTVNNFLRAVRNNTAATNQDLFRTLSVLSAHGEIDVRSADSGKIKRP